VTRAGSTGGGRTYRGQMPMKWYSSLVLICILGVALVVYSRYEREHPAPATQPAIGAHWYQALSFDVCGKLTANLPVNPNASSAPVPGIRTEGDGVIQVAPTAAADAGNNATLARFVHNYPGLKLTPSTLKLPATQAYTTGHACPSGTPDAGKPSVIRIKMWPSFTPPGSNNPQYFTDPGLIKLADGQLITVAFVPPSASIPKPDSIVALLNDRAGSATSSTTTPPVATSTTAPSSTTTTKPATTTTKPSSTSTTKPSTTTTKPATTTTKPATTTTKP